MGLILGRGRCEAYRRVLIALVLVFGMLFVGVPAHAVGGVSGITNLTAKWVSVDTDTYSSNKDDVIKITDNGKKIEANSITDTWGNYPELSATAQYSASFSGEGTVPAHSFKMVLPSSMFVHGKAYVSGNDSYQVGTTQCPTTDMNGLCYTVEDGNIVVTNGVELSAGTSVSVSVSYSYELTIFNTPDVVDVDAAGNASASDDLKTLAAGILPVSASVDGGNKMSTELVSTFNSYVTLKKVYAPSASSMTVVSSWNDAWGAKSGGADSYDYLVVPFYGALDDSGGGQAGTISWELTGLDNGGEVVGYTSYKKGGNAELTDTTSGRVKTSDFIETSNGAWYGSYGIATAVIRYPKGTLTGSNDITVGGHIKATVVGIEDGVESSSEVDWSKSLTHIDFTAPPGNNRLDKKSGRDAYDNEAEGSLSNLRNDLPAYFTWESALNCVTNYTAGSGYCNIYDLQDWSYTADSDADLSNPDSYGKRRSRMTW